MILWGLQVAGLQGQRLSDTVFAVSLRVFEVYRMRKPEFKPFSS